LLSRTPIPPAGQARHLDAVAVGEAERDRERLNRRLDEALAALAELRGKTDELRVRVDEIQRDADDFNAKLDKLVVSGGGQPASATFQPVAQLSV
jgi:uncharacterized membrane protein